MGRTGSDVSQTANSDESRKPANRSGNGAPQLLELLRLVALGESALTVLGWNVDEVVDTFNRRFGPSGPTQADHEGYQQTDPLIANEARKALTPLVEVNSELAGLAPQGWAGHEQALCVDYMTYLEIWIRHLQTVAAAPEYWDLDPGENISLAWHAAIRTAHRVGVDQEQATRSEINRLFPLADLDTASTEMVAGPPLQMPPSPPLQMPTTAPKDAPRKPAVQVRTLVATAMALIGGLIITPLAVTAGQSGGQVTIADIAIGAAVWFVLVWGVGWLVSAASPNR